MAKREGWQGWDEYAPFYDWENARTLGRRDVPFWRNVALQSKGPVLELGCGTGRISLPLARAGVKVVGIDRSAPMLERAAKRLAAQRRREGGRKKKRLQLVRGDIRYLPFEAASFKTVLAPYGILQSLVRDKDLTATLASVANVLAPGGLFGVDLVPDVPNWREYSNQIQLKGRASGGAHLTLVESVRQDRKAHLTIFNQTYIERRGQDLREHTFDLTFRTLPIPTFTRRLEKAGFRVEAVLGDYRGGPWDARADVWIMLARRL
ncbi:MAG: class I SAM-dependent methyltransferase [Vicinamibacterales bacterium]